MDLITASATIEEALQRSLIVIPSINGGTLLERMLPTLRVPARIVVVLDQGSTDQTADVCSRHGVEIVQLGGPKTYTEACNIGLELAKARGCEFIFFSNNDIAFTTDVTRELLGELIEDSNLGMLAPSQVIIDATNGTRRVSYRSFWDLQRSKFAHDYKAPPILSKRLESDFCELTFALARVAVLEAVGGLDNEYGFYHEDADLGFRLWDAGYASAYLPQSQIEHYAGSTFGAASDRRTAYIQRSKATFARNHLGFGVKHVLPGKDATGFDASVARQLNVYLARYGLLDEDRPELASYANAKPVPLSVETDVFHPWGPSLDLAGAPEGGTTFLWLGRDRDRDGLDVLLDIWGQHFRRHPQSRLVLVGSEILGTLDGASPTWHRDGCVVRSAPAAGITVYETAAGFDSETLASIYRGADFLVCTAATEGPGSVVAESLACGTPAIFPGYGAGTDFTLPNALTLEPGPSDLDRDALLKRLTEAEEMNRETYDRLAMDGVRLVRARFTWRTTVMAIRRALADVQTRKTVSIEEPAAVAAPAVSVPRGSRSGKKPPLGTRIRRRLAKWARRSSSPPGDRKT